MKQMRAGAMGGAMLLTRGGRAGRAGGARDDQSVSACVQKWKGGMQCSRRAGGGADDRVQSECVTRSCERVWSRSRAGVRVDESQRRTKRRALGVLGASAESSVGWVGRAAEMVCSWFAQSSLARRVTNHHRPLLRLKRNHTPHFTTLPHHHHDAFAHHHSTPSRPGPGWSRARLLYDVDVC